MAASTDISPYYDDFNEEKNFHRVLFRPGVAVQARELTQSQTILQNQIKRVGDYLFTDGTKISGAKPTVNTQVRTVRITSLPDNTSDISQLIGKFVTSSNNSDIIGEVVAAYDINDPNIGDPYSIVIVLKKASKDDAGIFEQNILLNYYDTYIEAVRGDSSLLKSILSSDLLKNTYGSATRFSKEITLTNPTDLVQVGDLMVHPSFYVTRTRIDPNTNEEISYQVLDKRIYVTEIKSPTVIVVSESPDVNINNELIEFITKACNPTTLVTQDVAVFYNKGYLVRCPLQSIVPDKNTAYPTKMLGLLIDEVIITSNDDETLLDPALESSNYFAQGADRLKIGLTIVSYDLDENGKPNTEDEFIPLLKFNKGETEYINDTSTDTAIDRKLAQRTYEESGSYVVDNFQIIPIETTSESPTMDFSISAGTAYVGGARISTVGPTELRIPKNVETETIENYNINTTQGNYFRVANVKYSLISPQQVDSNEIFLETHSVRNPANSSTKIGFVAFKSLEYDTYDGDIITYKLFNYYIAQDKDAPDDWELWGQRYAGPFGVTIETAQWLASILYSGNDSLGEFPEYTYSDVSQQWVLTGNNIEYFGLYRAPDAAGIAFWTRYYLQDAESDIEETKKAFIYEALVKGEEDRITTDDKAYEASLTGGTFYYGISITDDIQSFVGVDTDLSGPGASGTYANPSFYAEIAPGGRDNTTGKVILFDKSPTDSLIFPLGKPFIKSVTDISTEYYKVFSTVSFTSGVYSRTFSAPETLAVGDTPSLSAGTARANFILVIKSGATVSVPLGVWDFEAGGVAVSGSSGTLEIDLGDSTFNGTADLAVKLENDDLPIRSKTLNRYKFKQLDITQADIDYSVKTSDILEYRGVFKLPTVGVFRGNWTASNSYTYNDVVMDKGYMYQALDATRNVSTSFANAWTVVKTDNLNNYVLDDGQRDAIYDHGVVRYIGPTSSIPGNVIVSLDYFSHTGEGPVVAASYGPELYASIPNYRSVFDSTVYPLRDCIDFRPRRIDDQNYHNYDGFIIPTSTVNTEATVEYYLGRIDRIYVTNNLKNLDSPYNRFSYSQGTEAFNPVAPEDLSDVTKMSIATIDIPPFTVSGFDVLITYDDNKRYTMKDIGKLDDEVVNLGKAIKLQAIEVSVLKSVILDSDENVLLKSGIFVDDFSNFSKGDLTSGYFACTIDVSTKECKPSLAVYQVDLEIDDETGVTVNNDLVTLKYEEEEFASQREANNNLVVNPGAVDDLRGRASLGTKNSFKLNTTSTGGLLASSTQALKMLEAYILESDPEKSTSGQNAYYSAYVGEAVLAAAWKATRDANLGFLESVIAIDTITRLMSGPTSTLANASEFIYELIQGGFNTVVPEFTVSDDVEDITTNIITSPILAGLIRGIEVVNNVLGNILGGNFDYGAGGILDGIFRISQSLISNTFNDIISDANRAARSAVGIDITIIDPLYVADLPITHAELLPIPPAPRRRRRRKWFFGLF